MIPVNSLRTSHPFSLINIFNPLVSVHPCDEKNGGCEHECVRKGTNAVCKCKEGFKLNADGKTCNKIHPCDKKDNGGCSHTCLKIEAEEEEEEETEGYKCACPTGFSLDEDMKTCEPVHPCDTTNKGGCEHICTKDGKKTVCSCKKGFTLEEDGESCEQIHPCDEPNKGGCEQICSRKGLEAVCKCRPRFLLKEDNRTCEPGK